MDVVVIRENEEDLYAGIEHRQTDEVVQCLKLITRPGCEKIVRYAFEYARARRRRGSVGLAPSANVGDHGAMFEAFHGSAPDIAGRNIANPSGLLLSAVKMLAHVGQGDVASAIHNAWLCVIEDGVHTADIHRPGISGRGPPRSSSATHLKMSGTSYRISVTGKKSAWDERLWVEAR